MNTETRKSLENILDYVFIDEAKDYRMTKDEESKSRHIFLDIKKVAYWLHALHEAGVEEVERTN